MNIHVELIPFFMCISNETSYMIILYNRDINVVIIKAFPYNRGIIKAIKDKCKRRKVYCTVFEFVTI